ncbi:nucleoside/nucleotide kinase family protein [Paraburkholderia tropica]|uniref:hypothetical protein n=1 Tax=Paraburkholderia tropica TaxID=92647 RepID=UPI002AB7D560|nr:hypothetical protein [Paraburkholderia tropica]
MRKGLHIAFSGVDGAGKSTQAARVARYLDERGRSSFRFENKSEYALQVMKTAALRNGVVDGRSYFGNELFDFAKSIEVVRDHFTLIEPIINSGVDVVVPRSIICRIALARAFGLSDANFIRNVYDLTPPPDVIFWLDISGRVAAERVEKRGVDKEDPDFLEIFSFCLKEELGRTDTKVIKINAGENENDVWEMIEAELENLILEGSDARI